MTVLEKMAEDLDMSPDDLRKMYWDVASCGDVIEQVKIYGYCQMCRRIGIGVNGGKHGPYCVFREVEVVEQ